VTRVERLQEPVTCKALLKTDLPGIEGKEFFVEHVELAPGASRVSVAHRSGKPPGGCPESCRDMDLSSRDWRCSPTCRSALQIGPVHYHGASNRCRPWGGRL